MIYVISFVFVIGLMFVAFAVSNSANEQRRRDRHAEFLPDHEGVRQMLNEAAKRAPRDIE